MELPRALIGKACALVLTQRLQEHLRESLLFHVSERVFVDLVSMSRAEQFEEIDAAFRARAFEPGEMLVTDVGDVAVFALMSRARVIDRHIR